MALVSASDLRKTYDAGDIPVEAIRGVNFTIEPASFVSFVGPSGSGKSTLLNMIGCLDPPTGGTLTVAGQDVRLLNAREAARFRGSHIGFIFQDFNLIPVLTSVENVELPLAFFRKPGVEGEVERLLVMLGMEHRMNHLPGQINTPFASISEWPFILGCSCRCPQLASGKNRPGAGGLSQGEGPRARAGCSARPDDGSFDQWVRSGRTGQGIRQSPLMAS
jgi:hypothetical protein